MMKDVCIIGSINMDMVAKVNKMPQKGETVLSYDFKKISGGKGANQAVAAKRLGANVHMVGKVGRDDNGKDLMNLLKKEGINTDYIYLDDSNPTGMAFINVDDNGENSIVVVPGSNMNINIDEIRNAQNVIKDSKVVISQFETTIESTIVAFKIAKQNNISTILNPAPVREIPEDLLAYTDIIIPNETEASKFTGIEVKDIESLKESCKIILNKGVKFVIITLGDKGAAIACKEKFELIPAYKVKAVDTTAAGDGFIGALASNLAEENINFENIKKAVQFANKVSSIIVQKEGAQPSLPYLNEVMESFEGEKND